MLRVIFKTMPIRRKFKTIIGEPTFLYSVKAELNHNGQFEEIILVDEE